MKRRKKKKPVVVTCRYCAAFWAAPSRKEGAVIMRACRIKGAEVSGNDPICEAFTLSKNITCEHFSSRMDNVCCIGRALHRYGDAYCYTKCRQVKIIRTSYKVMEQPIPEPRKPDINQIKAPETRPVAIVGSAGGNNKPTLKRRANHPKKRVSSGPTVKKLRRRKTSAPSTPVVRKLKRRRK